MTEDTRLSPRLEEWIAQCEAMGQTDLAAQYRKALQLVEADRREYWNTPLTYAEAHEWGGYDESSLRRLVREGKIPPTSGGVRRRHVPVRPGHVMPLGLEPNEDEEQNWMTSISEQREAS